jgi:hypothetical protein
MTSPISSTIAVERVEVLGALAGPVLGVDVHAGVGAEDVEVRSRRTPVARRDCEPWT